MNWNSPEQRLSLLEKVGHDEYSRRIKEHQAKSVVETCNGHEIRIVQSPYGRLYHVGTTKMAYQSIGEARDFARRETYGFELFTTPKELSAWYLRYCKANDLPALSADELAHELNNGHKCYDTILAFSDRWSKLTD